MSIKRDWTWIRALHKELMRGTSTHKRYEFPLSVVDMELLYKLQDGKCALSGLEFYLPYDCNALPPGTTWSSCRELLPRYQAMTPDLVRVENEGFWMIGNVVYIAHGWKELYLGYGRHRLMQECQALIANPLVVPRIDAVTRRGVEEPSNANT